MANKEHVRRLLNNGVDAWNEWRRTHPQIIPDLRGARLAGADLRRAFLNDANLREAKLSSAILKKAVLKEAVLVKTDLSRVDLSGADLRQANLRDANLTGAYLSNADFSEANLTGAYLTGPNLYRANLNRTNLNRANLSGADLREAILSKANLSRADLSNADLSGADLSDADLAANLALGANFKGATLTGACIQNWNINSQTKLEEIICNFVYIEANQKERRPSDPNQDFKAGDLEKLVKRSISTIDLIFRNGINWEAFAQSFQQLQINADQLQIIANNIDLDIQAIENKGNGNFVIRVSVPPSSDKARIQRFMEHEYQVALKQVEDKYRSKLYAQEREIEIYRLQSTNLLEIAKLAARQPPIYLEGTRMSGNQYTFNQPQFGGDFVTEGGQHSGDTVTYFSQTEDLADAALQIQRLLTQLQSEGDDSSEDKAAEHLAAQAKQDSQLLGNLVSWGKSLRDDAVNSASEEVAKVAGATVAKTVITKALALLGLSLI